jgi:hypothetical protein
MRSRWHPTPPPAPDLIDLSSEAIRRTLYDLVVAVQFPSEPSETRTSSSPMPESSVIVGGGSPILRSSRRGRR